MKQENFASQNYSVLYKKTNSKLFIQQKNKNKIIYFFPKTKIGKISFWIVVSCFLFIVLMNVIVGIQHRNDYCDENGICYSPPEGVFRTFNIIFSLIAMSGIVIAGVISIIAIVKYRDFAIFLFLSGLIGLFGIMFVLGEFLVPH